MAPVWCDRLSPPSGAFESLSFVANIFLVMDSYDFSVAWLFFSLFDGFCGGCGFGLEEEPAIDCDTFCFYGFLAFWSLFY